MLMQGQPAYADPPFTPTFTATADEVAPGDPSILPLDDDCPVGALCKVMGTVQIPDGQPGTTYSMFVSAAAAAFLMIPVDQQIPDGAIIRREFGSTRVGLVGSCAAGSVYPFDSFVLDATTDPATTTGDPSDLLAFDRWPSQLDGIRDAVLAANPGAQLVRRSVTKDSTLDFVANSLGFVFSDGSAGSIRINGNPLVPPTFEICGPIDANNLVLGLTMDNPDTPIDESGIPILVCVSPGLVTIEEDLDRADTPPGDPITLQDTVNCSPNTPADSDVSVPLNGGTDVVAGLSVTFQETTGGGTTTVVTTQVGPPPPTGFNVAGLGGVPLYFDISTTATFVGDVEVCTKYDDTGLTAQQEADLQLLQYDGVDWVDRTISINTADNIICGTAPSFSVWAVMAPSAVGGVVELVADADAPADVSGSSARDYAAPIAAAIATAVVALAAGGWYARRRWSQ